MRSRSSRTSVWNSWRSGWSLMPSLCGCVAAIALLDHLIRSQQERLRDGQPECPGRLAIDHELELRGLLDGKIARLRALEDLVDVCRGPPGERGDVRSVRHEAPRV